MWGMRESAGVRETLTAGPNPDWATVGDGQASKHPARSRSDHRIERIAIPDLHAASSGAHARLGGEYKPDTRQGVLPVRESTRLGRGEDERCAAACSSCLSTAI